MCNFLTFLILRSMADMSHSASRTLMSYFLSFKKLFNDRDLLLFFSFNFYLFLAVLGLWCNTQASCCGGFSFCRAQALGHIGSVVVAHGLSCPAACGMLVPSARTEPMYPALAGGFWATIPPGKSLTALLSLYFSYTVSEYPNKMTSPWPLNTVGFTLSLLVVQTCFLRRARSPNYWRSRHYHYSLGWRHQINSLVIF